LCWSNRTRSFFAKGYGYANLESKRPFDPNRTTLRAASITKTFTATAIMQLMEQGKLDLNQDISSYFPELNLSSDFPEPITVGDYLLIARVLMKLLSDILQKKRLPLSRSSSNRKFPPV
jgi:CubicO group peptidase (beta-lactamase class C family)